MASLTGEPTQLVDDDATLEWMLYNGDLPPKSLADCAAHRMVEQSRL